MQVIVSCSSNLSEELFSGYSDVVDFKLIKGFTYDLMKHAKLGIIKSGTSTLEAGYFALPMIIVYKTNYLTYLVVKKLIKVDSIGMVNILIEEKILPELIQNRLTENSIYKESKKILSNSSEYEKIKTKLSEVKNKLAGETASVSAAKSIYKIINEL
jgi:lipid-A-disaccharide synthase